MSRAKKKTTVKRTEEDPPDEILAKHITEIAKATRKLMGGPLKERTIVLLISKASGVSQRDVKKVLAASENLAHTYLKKPKLS